jgi:pimeloyl-ACP methyl ester carboxylesterase
MSYTDLTADIYFDGATTSLSGRLFRPEMLPYKGIIVYHPGTPTHPPYSATEGKFDVLAEALLPSGCAVLVPDYIGYGIHSGDAHPRYLYRPHAGLESFHLLKQVISDLRKEDVLEPTPDIRICGYSLGAYHAMGLLQRLEAIPELCRPTLFAGGGIFDLSSQFARMLEHDRYDAPAYIVHLLRSLLGPQDTIACFAPIHQPSVAAFFKTHSKDLATLNETLPR